MISSNDPGMLFRTFFAAKARQKGLHEFVQMLLSKPRCANHEAVKSFFLNTPRHVSSHYAFTHIS